MEKHDILWPSHIGRGRVFDKKAGPLYRVESLDMAGVKTRWVEAVNASVNEYKGDPPVQDKKEYSIGNEVFFIMFPDGRGLILGRMRRDI